MLEIAEMILLNLSFTDIMRMEQTCKGIRDIVDASSKLQTQIYLKPAAVNTQRVFPFAGSATPGFRCSKLVDDTSSEEQGRVYAWVRVEVDKSGIYWPQIGERLEKMLICQPPIYGALATEHCPLDDNDMFGDTQAIQIASQTGLTLGNVFDAVEEFTNIHKSCWEGADPIQFSLSSNGRETFRVHFIECLTEEAWDETAEATASHRKYVARALREETESKQVLEVDDVEEDDVSQSAFDYTEGASWSRQPSPSEISSDVKYGNYGDQDRSRNDEEFEFEYQDEDRDAVDADGMEYTQGELAAMVYEGYGDDVAA